jgi:hypothetical protein
MAETFRPSRASQVAVAIFSVNDGFAVASRDWLSHLSVYDV